METMSEVVSVVDFTPVARTGVSQTPFVNRERRWRTDAPREKGEARRDSRRGLREKGDPSPSLSTLSPLMCSEKSSPPYNIYMYVIIKKFKLCQTLKPSQRNGVERCVIAAFFFTLSDESQVYMSVCWLHGITTATPFA